MVYTYLAIERNTQANTIHKSSKGDGNLLRKHSRVPGTKCIFFKEKPSWEGEVT